jgi:hypothetical protein
VYSNPDLHDNDKWKDSNMLYRITRPQQSCLIVPYESQLFPKGYLAEYYSSRAIISFRELCTFQFYTLATKEFSRLLNK